MRQLHRGIRGDMKLCESSRKVEGSVEFFQPVIRGSRLRKVVSPGVPRPAFLGGHEFAH